MPASPPVPTAPPDNPIPEKLSPVYSKPHSGAVGADCFGYQICWLAPVRLTVVLHSSHRLAHSRREHPAALAPDFHYCHLVYPDPSFFALGAYGDLDSPQRSIQRSDPVAIRDGRRAPSDIAAGADDDAPARLRFAVAPTDRSDGQDALQQDILFNR